MKFGFPQIVFASLVIAIGGFLLLKNPTPVQPAPEEHQLEERQLNVQQQQGFALTTSYCADCHAVGRTGESLHPPAPKFRELHERYDVTFLEEALVEGLVAHPDMPEFEFDILQAQAIIAYLETLQTQ